ncbi:hypothetical protein JCM19037_1627 [Geomicrobium sp. JCM 19037]|uniref:hypothetical protein n=1 Tax=Geomicrobium sp. JCM 19037 TaxID=1460634 RepID=UPI00045F2E8F|nr:hypothetical protein [Geomicrobium sp. JCM 19037]GAK03312.1 hypothetical protein JCM19037_1627 [Geomicrobium sp. JCM 19037]
MTKISTRDWRALPIEKWNANTHLQMLVDLTEKRFGVDYQPGGRGGKQQRWSMERGMLKQAQGKYGNVTLRKFIELCLDEYKPSAEYPFVQFTFMYAYRDRNWAVAQKAVADAARKRRKEDEAEAAYVPVGDRW